MNWFYAPDQDLSSRQISLTKPEECHHFKDVLRLKKNSPVAVFDGKGTVAEGIAADVASQKIGILLKTRRRQKKKNPEIVLACALPKKAKFEWIIEKTTELGVSEIIPMITDRTEVKVPPAKRKKRLTRYHSLAVNACKQSHQAFVPRIEAFLKFKGVLASEKDKSDLLIPSLQKPRKNILETLKALKNPKRILFLIGPEGDFTPEEYASASEAGAVPVSLGESILKVETAAVCSTSAARLYYFS